MFSRVKRLVSAVPRKTGLNSLIIISPAHVFSGNLCPLRGTSMGTTQPASPTCSIQASMRWHRCRHRLLPRTLHGLLLLAGGCFTLSVWNLSFGVPSSYQEMNSAKNPKPAVADPHGEVPLSIQVEGNRMWKL